MNEYKRIFVIVLHLESEQCRIQKNSEMKA